MISTHTNLSKILLINIQIAIIIAELRSKMKKQLLEFKLFPLTHSTKDCIFDIGDVSRISKIFDVVVFWKMEANVLSNQRMCTVTLQQKPACCYQKESFECPLVARCKLMCRLQVQLQRKRKPFPLRRNVWRQKKLIFVGGRISQLSDYAATAGRSCKAKANLQMPSCLSKKQSTILCYCEQQWNSWNL